MMSTLLDGRRLFAAEDLVPLISEHVEGQRERAMATMQLSIWLEALLDQTECQVDRRIRARWSNL